MKKLLTLFLALSLSIASITACGTPKKEADPEPAETTTEAAIADDALDFTAFLDAVYAAQPGTAGESEKIAAAAEAFKAFAFANGEAVTPAEITAATEAYLAEKSATDDAFLANFTDSFDAICDALVEEDESIETDTSFLKFVNGISAALETAGVSESGVDFTTCLEAIYAAQPGTAGASEKVPAAAEAFKTFAFANGEAVTEGEIATAAEAFLTEKSAEDEAYVANFTESFDAVCETLIEEDESIETDTSFLKFMNGIADALEAFAE